MQRKAGWKGLSCGKSGPWENNNGRGRRVGNRVKIDFGMENKWNRKK
jgi:hypothetical protein